METYGGNSLEGWLHGDATGGYYLDLLEGAGPLVGAPGMAGWDQNCSGAPCWTNSPESGQERLARLGADGVAELAVFRLVQQDGAPKMPQVRGPTYNYQ